MLIKLSTLKYVYDISIQSTESNKEQHDLIYLRYKNDIIDIKKKIESIIEDFTCE